MIDQDQFVAEIRNTFSNSCDITVSKSEAKGYHYARVVFNKDTENEYPLGIHCESHEDSLLWSVVDNRTTGDWFTGDTLREAVEKMRQDRKTLRDRMTYELSTVELRPTMNKDKFLAEIREGLCHPDVWIIMDSEDPDDLEARVFLSSEEDAVANDEPLTVSYSFDSWKVGVSGGGVSFKEALGGCIDSTLVAIERKQRMHKRILTAMHVEEPF